MVGTSLTSAPVLHVADAEGRAVPNVEVVFTVATGGGSVSGGTVMTNAEGKAQFERLALGRYSIEVRKDGYSPMLRGFQAGSEAPTLKFTLELKAGISEVAKSSPPPISTYGVKCLGALKFHLVINGLNPPPYTV